jgi:hypothetical protein
VAQQRQHQWHIVNDYDFHAFSGKGGSTNWRAKTGQGRVTKQDATPAVMQALRTKSSRDGQPGQPQSTLSHVQGREYNQIKRNKQIFMIFVKFFVFRHFEKS